AEVDCRQSIHRERRQLLPVDFRSGVDEREINSEGAAVAAGATRRIEIDAAEAVRVGRKRELVDERRRDRAGQAQRGRAVRAGPKGLEIAQRALKRTAEMPGNMRAAEGEPVLVGEKIIDFDRILARVGPAREAAEPVAGTLLKSGRGLGITVEKRTPVRT